MRAESSTASLANFVLMGDVGCGKTALMAALLEDGSKVLKTQAPVFHPNNVVDTPGEFTNRRACYGALLSTIADVDTIVYLQPADSAVFSMPAGLFKVYPNKRVLGVISKIDLPGANIDRARKLLKNNGISAPYFAVSTLNDIGIKELRAYLTGLQDPAPLCSEPVARSSERGVRNELAESAINGVCS